jgi:hypothetical protein
VGVPESPTSDDVAPEPTETPSPTTSTPSPAQLRAEAIARMEDMVDSDRELDPIRNQWVAQLSSKYEGIVDKSQQARPFTASQILAEIQTARDNPEYGSQVRVVHQGDWGGSEPLAKTMWVTFVDLDAASRDEVLAWCESHYDQRGKALLNVCYPRQMHRR